MRGVVRGTLYCALWYGSIVAGFLFIACPMLPLLFLSPPKFRKCGDRLFSCWELYSTALLKMFGVKIVVSGDHILPDESAILVMNHRTRVDWNFLWAAMYQACLPSIAAHRLKFVLKDAIRHIPGPGWIMQMNGFLYITRRWEVDRDRLSRTLDYLVALGRRSQLLIFPEGTDLTKTSKEKSDKYAVQHVLPQYTFTLHPKTTGFSYLTEVDLIKGNLPSEIHFHIKRIPSADVPTQDLTLRRWLEDKWFDKEQILNEFYQEKRFSAEAWPLTRLRPLYVAFVFWTILTGAAVVLMFTSPVFQLWALIHAVFFVALSLFTTGFSQLEMGWFWRWKSHFSTAKKCS
ncbi:lysocardiolipin acyltransferase 1-like isoform X2 [Ceratina calcarata]|uniref:Lysocardiolipin acyltransferase 1-like isoform X2 n=1 Tax=Ceratina calcarata TaxID=156304 RepID=A0AAJ7IWD4_9HYME|nr:lysocardiolipin acyltransferase 1-like isoform X2 [Ceratina calcarata]